MGKKFTAIYESVLSRYSIGGYLPGDVVQFRPSYKSTDCFKSMNTVMQKEIDELINSGLNIRVIQVGDKMSGASAGNQHKSADMVVITVAADQGGGRYYQAYTVTPNMIDLVDQSDFTVKVPDKFYHNSEINLKPVEHVTDHQNITRLTDKGDGKNTPNKLNESYGTQVTNDNDTLKNIIEEMYSPNKDYTLIYEKVLIEEGMLRRLATKFAGGFKSNPLQKQNRSHQFAQSAALEIGKDISKSFGGDYNTHAKALYNHILDYISNVS